MNQQTPKRFIAGAICPRCNAMDRIRSWESNGTRYRECVSCDFFEQLPMDEESLDPLDTRVSKNRPEPESDDFQPVKIIDPGKH
ncbi:YheV family putative metal-binding protein [Kushneria sp. AK178]